MFTPAGVIQQKRDGHELTEESIRQFIQGITDGTIADYQATAFLMAIYFQGMTMAETVALTRAMVESGERYTLATLEKTKVDKHSTGGVGDKVSLILAPLAAACGLTVPMMAGRGLGHSGGTIDKLESIPNYRPNLSRAEFEKVLRDVGCAIISQSTSIAPADKKLYSLRDVTATIDCIPLIVASILSKKIAEGTQGLVLDIKVGNGAFMKSRPQARRLTRAITQVAKKMGLSCRALLTDMNQPLGYASGNAIEVIECIEVLRNQRLLPEELGETSSSDLKELTIQTCAHMLHIGKVVKSLTEGRKLAHARLADGSAWEKFRRMIQAQGGDLSALDDPWGRLSRTPRRLVWTAKRRGYITKIDTETMGWILVELGAGRKKTTDRIDFGSGMIFHHKLGSQVQVGDPIVTVFAPDRPRAGTSLEELETLFERSVEIKATKKPVPKLISEVIG